MEPGLLIVLLESRYTGQEESDSCSPPADLEVLGFSSKRDESGNARKQIIGIVGEDVYLTMDSGFESYTSFWRTFVH
ncbi:hypothetical protein FRC02_008894 [Tulasnella sp. 418]|nr:hypothetical protein FRC02_008894 [Tulasnella sp. 418]